LLNLPQLQPETPTTSSSIVCLLLLSAGQQSKVACWLWLVGHVECDILSDDVPKMLALYSSAPVHCYPDDEGVSCTICELQWISTFRVAGLCACRTIALIACLTENLLSVSPVKRGLICTTTAPDRPVFRTDFHFHCNFTASKRMFDSLGPEACAITEPLVL